MDGLAWWVGKRQEAREKLEALSAYDFEYELYFLLSFAALAITE